MPSACAPGGRRPGQKAGSTGFGETRPSPRTPLIGRRLAALVLSSGLLRRVKSVEEALFCVISSGSHRCAQHLGVGGAWRWEKLVPGLFLWADSSGTQGGVPASSSALPVLCSGRTGCWGLRPARAPGWPGCGQTPLASLPGAGRARCVRLPAALELLARVRADWAGAGCGTPAVCLSPLAIALPGYPGE